MIGYLDHKTLQKFFQINTTVSSFTVGIHVSVETSDFLKLISRSTAVPNVVAGKLIDIIVSGFENVYQNNNLCIKLGT